MKRKYDDQDHPLKLTSTSPFQDWFTLCALFTYFTVGDWPILQLVCKLWSQKRCYRNASASDPDHLLGYEHIQTLRLSFWNQRWQCRLHDFHQLKSLSISLERKVEMIRLTMLPSCTSLVILSIRSWTTILFPPHVQYLLLTTHMQCRDVLYLSRIQYSYSLPELLELYLDGALLAFEAKDVPKLKKAVFVNINFSRIISVPTFPSTCDVTLWGYCSYPRNPDFPWCQVSTLVLSDISLISRFEELSLPSLNTLLLYHLPTVDARLIPCSVEYLIIAECGDVEKEVFALPHLKRVIDARSTSQKESISSKCETTQLNIVNALRDFQGLITTLNWNLYGKFGGVLF